MTADSGKVDKLGIGHTASLLFLVGFAFLAATWLPLLNANIPDNIFYLGVASGTVATQLVRALSDELKRRWGSAHNE